MSKQPLMIEWLKTKQFIQKSTLKKQAPPGPAPRPGLIWRPQTHRWVRNQSQEWHQPKDLSGSQFISDNKDKMDKWFASSKEDIKRKHGRFSYDHPSEVGVWSNRVDTFQTITEENMIKDLKLKFSNDSDKEDFKSYVGERVQRIWHAEIANEKDTSENDSNSVVRRRSARRLHELVTGKKPPQTYDAKHHIVTGPPL